MSVWLLRAVLAGGILVLAAELLERALTRLGRPRRWAWVLALSASALLPLLAGLLPPLPGGVALTPEEVARLLGRAGAAAAPAPVPVASVWPSLLLGGWLAATLGLLALLAYTALRLGRARRGWLPARVDGTEVLLSPRSGPAVVGLLRPAVVLPAWVASAPAEERRMVLAHEREHVRAGDPWLLAGASVLTALLPWNPAVWWAQRRLRLALESDCDARVLASGIDRVRYGTFLLSTAARHGGALGLSVALVESRTSLERRIHAMTRKLPKNRAWALLPLGAAALLAAVACDVAAPTGERDAPAATQSPEAAEAAARGAQGAGKSPLVRAVPDNAGNKAFYFAEGRRPGEASGPAHEGERSSALDRQVEEVPSAGPRHFTTIADKPHVFVDGREVPGFPKFLDETRIQRVDVLKSEAARRFFFEKRMTDDGRGVVMITTKDAARK